MNAATRNRRIVQSTGIVMGTILLSRILGFLREWMVAHQMGSSAITDSYYAAFTLPDFLNNLVAAGALGLVFVPVFTKYLAEDRESEAWHVFSTVMTFMTIVLGILIVLGEIFTPQLVRMIAPGFRASEQSEVVFLTRVMLPAQVFFYLGSVMAAAQNAKTRFLIPALAAVVYNLGIIAGGWLLSPRIGVTGFAVGLLVGTFCGFFLLQSLAVWRMGAKFKPNLDLHHPGFRLFIKLAIPLMLALSIEFTDNWMIRWFGSFLEPSSITRLTFARTLMLMPLSTITYAIGVASFPFLTQLHSEGKPNELNRTLNTTLKGLVLCLVPISALTVVLSKPLIYFVFSHTRLRESDFLATALALALFSLGMFARGAQNLISRSFNATHDTVTPAVAGTAFTLLTLPIYWYAGRRWGFAGLAAASSFSLVIYAVFLFALLIRKTRNRHAGGVVLCFTKVVVSSVFVALACSQLTVWLESRLAWQTAKGAFAILMIVTLLGLPSILLLARLLGVMEVETYWKKLVPWVPKRVVVVPE
jgi:putative peptidoglycan lipid II flippase